MLKTTLPALAAGWFSLAAAAHAQRYPTVDQTAATVVQTYQTSSCRQPAAGRASADRPARRDRGARRPAAARKPGGERGVHQPRRRADRQPAVRVRPESLTPATQVRDIVRDRTGGMSMPGEQTPTGALGWLRRQADLRRPGFWRGLPREKLSDRSLTVLLVVQMLVLFVVLPATAAGLPLPTAVPVAILVVSMSSVIFLARQ